ncbi:MAG: hypothetical protein WC732_04110 [Candidatus Omnitrophota bacterium]
MVDDPINIGFLLHPLTVTQLRENFANLYLNNYLASKLKNICAGLPLTFYKKYYSSLPVKKICDIRNISSLKDSHINLKIFLLPLFPDQIITFSKDYILKFLINAVRKAEKEEIDLFALGGFTSIFGNQGAELINFSKIAITSGNALTAALCANGIIKAANIRRVPLDESTILIIGCTGDIGMACARFFKNKCKKLVLCSRNVFKHNEFISEMTNNASSEVVFDDNFKKHLHLSNIVLTSTSSLIPLFELNDLRENCICCDVSLPKNIFSSIPPKKNIFVFSGGLAKLSCFNSINDRIWKILFPSNSIYGCLAEAIVLGFEKKVRNYSIGRGNITIKTMEEIFEAAIKNGLDLADFISN